MQKFYYSFTTARGKKMASIYRKKGNDVWYYCITYSGKKYQGCTKTTDKLSAKLIAETKQTDIAREKNDLPALKKTVVNFPTAWREYYKRLANEPATLISKNDLRHVFASKMVINDISARVVIKANGFYSGSNVACILPANSWDTGLPK